jgi:hypothetical protein
MKQALGADFEVVTDVSTSNVTHPVVQTVADDKVDVVADTFVANYDRYKYVDFAYQTQVKSKQLFSVVFY